MPGKSIQSQLAELADSLPRSQRGIAELLRSDPERIAFGTLKSVAEGAETSATSVLRLASTMGFDGFADLRAAVRDEVSSQLRSAVGRIRDAEPGPLIERARAVELANIERTFASLDDELVDAVTTRVADRDRHLWVLPSSQTAGIGSLLADNLAICRPEVTLLAGSPFRIMTVLTELAPDDVLITVDVQRHERWLVEIQHHAVARGAVPVVLTDRLPCSLDLTDGFAIACGCESTSPFESQVGLVAAGNVLVSAVADRLRASVAARVDALEDTWVDNSLFDG